MVKSKRWWSVSGCFCLIVFGHENGVLVSYEDEKGDGSNAKTMTNHAG